MSRHVFTQEERQRGGKTRAAQDSFTEMCELGYEALCFKRPGVALWIYQVKVRPHMQRKATAQSACERAAMQQTVLASHQGKRKAMH